MRPETFERRRQKVLAAACRLFTSEDYERVHMGAVAEAAEIAKPTLYRYFPSKEALFLAALEESLGQLVADVAALRRQGGPAETRLRGAISLVHKQIGLLAPALRAVESKGSDPNDRSRKLLRKGMRALRSEIEGLLDEATEDREFEPVDREVAALAIVGAVRMAAMVGTGSGRSATSLADLFINGLGGRRSRDSSSSAESRCAALPAAYGVAS
jgi:TetR/AcrR family transcriptional repressor of mexJK operon